MNIEVTRDNVIINKNSEKAHENEYRITECEFVFDVFTNSFQVKRAIFTILSTGEMYEVDIINNKCNIPSEVLEHAYETVKLGVYGYNIGENDELLNRFSPSYAEFVVPTGSYEEGAQSPEEITPSQYDLYSQALQEGLQEVDDKLDEVVDTVDGKIEEIDEAIENAERLDIDANKVGKITSITITKKDGTPEETEILDGEDGTSLESIEIKNRDLYVTYGGSESDLGQVVPNIQIGTTTTGLPSTNASVENVGTDLNPILNFTIPKGEAGAINMLIVNELPATGQEDTIYLVPLEEPESQENRYAEYVYINNAWELLGKIGIEVDLTDYYTKTETNNLLGNKVGFTDYATSITGGIVKVGNGVYMNSGNWITATEYTYSNYQNAGNGVFIGKGTLENVITGKRLISNTDYANYATAGVVKTNLSFETDSNGGARCNIIEYSNYPSANNRNFISKGTLENVITGKDLTTKAYVDGLVGNLETILTTLDIGGGAS